MTTLDTKTWGDMRGDYIDSRDSVARLAELEDAASEDPNDFGCTLCGEGSFPSEDAPSLCEDHGSELVTLRTFAEQGEGFADWEYGETFIPGDMFEDYARELADDIGAVNTDAGWPNSYIDWPAAADALKMDYTSLEVDGVTYWGRA
jgi:hypothetical protein